MSNSNSNSNNAKHRPLLSTKQLELFLGYLQQDPEPNAEVIVTKKYLASFLFKLSVGAKKVAYVANPRVSLSDSLGIGSSSNAKAAYDKWLADANACTPAELELVNEYRMVNQLMTDTEMNDLLMAQVDARLATE